VASVLPPGQERALGWLQAMVRDGVGVGWACVGQGALARYRPWRFVDGRRFVARANPCGPVAPLGFGC